MVVGVAGSGQPGNPDLGVQIRSVGQMFGVHALHVMAGAMQQSAEPCVHDMQRSRHRSIE